MKYRLIVLAVLFLPVVGNAQVLFSEIAWMGTTENANNEWIEIYNFSSTPTDINGWTLIDGGSLEIPLSGVMPPHGVFLLERTDDATVPGIKAAVIYTGALSNSGATLTIKDSGGDIVTELVGGDNWENIGGNNETKYTAQSTRTGDWVTGPPTPGLPNVEEEADIPKDEEEDDDESGTSSTTLKKNTPSSSSKKETNEPLSLSIKAPKVAYVNQKIRLEAIPDGAGKAVRNSLRYLWNFGDTNTSLQKNPEHIFKYPGDYIVMVEAEYAKHLVQDRHEIQVLNNEFTLKKTESGDALLVNESSNEADLYGFTLRGTKSFTFPRLSMLKAGGNITVPKEKFGSNSNSIILYDTQKTVVTSYPEANTGSVLGVSNSVPKVVYKAPAQVTAEKEVLVELSENIEAKTEVIRIGNTKENETPNRNSMARLFDMIFSFFRI